MQTLEAIFSLFMLVLLSMPLLALEEKPTDNSLYRLQLANDVWRVLYLKGDFKDFSFDKNNPVHARAEADLDKITELTGICVFISGEQLTSCRGEKTGEQIITMEKVLVVDGMPKKVSLMLAHKIG